MPSMLRLLRLRPNILSLTARANQSNRPSSQIIHVHRVNIRRKWFKPMNFIVAGCIYYMCYQVYTSSVLSTLGRWLDDQEKHLTEAERQEMEEAEYDPIFIPLPFTMRMVPSEPYKSTDPEWQAFVRVSKNREKVRGIQSGLADLVCKTASTHPMLLRRCGGNMKLGRYWLDIQYPSRPPPTFVRKGISIGDDGTYIAEETVDTVTAIQVRRALWPSTLTVSLWSFSGALLRQNASNFGKLFGYAPTYPDTSFQQAVEKLKKSTEEPNSKTPKSLSPANTRAAGSSSTDPTSPVEKRSAETTPDPRSSTTSSGSGVSSPVPIIPNAEPGKPKSAKDIYGIKTTQEHTSGPWLAFKQTFLQTWRPIGGFPPRGAIYVAGLVEITTPRAFITIDVTAWWDPKTEAFDMKSTSFRLKMIRDRTQSPLR
ncbi:hypothetical protein F4813DRAFT_394321 [Daldinia decipiens]|uniref:uncharacterized protein n=1 Tax=Daldinia decipiens TaxID=326647 RepID=UPI0020C2F7F4|nr:uncharacterized protein F4813DRAFT_394321 [Daldinia decipiens]KAI1652773.1 hypothetical protein F4813DRAFT_394321 [Daldinia decipiens]